MRVIFRQHSPADFEEIANLRWLLKSQDGENLSECGKNAFLEDYRNHLETCGNDGSRTYWLAEDSSRDIIGVMTIVIVTGEPSPDNPLKRWGYLTNCYVRQDVRNRGLGSELLANVKSWAKGEELELLIVWPSDRSYEFYRRAGFRGQGDPLELMLS